METPGISRALAQDTPDGYLSRLQQVREEPCDDQPIVNHATQESSQEKDPSELSIADMAQPVTDTARRPNPSEPARPSESGRTRPSVRIRPNSNLGRPSESGRTQIGDDRPNPAEKHIKHDRNHSFGSISHVSGSKLNF